MRKRNRVAEIAVRKLRRFLNTEWVGYLTAAEAVYLLDKGCKLTHSNTFKEEMFREMLKKGKGFSSWCYFRSITVIPPNDLPFK